MKRVAIIAGMRTPFVRAGTNFKELGPLELGVHCVKGLLEKAQIDPEIIEAIAYGVVVPEAGKPNLAREIVFETGIPSSIEAQTISSYCITGLRTLSAISDAIALGRIEVGIAGGVDSFSHADMDIFIEPTTGLSMGQHMELTAKEWDISREDQDKIALTSHENAIKAKEKLSQEIFQLLGIDNDTGPRSDTSLAALAGLNPVFDKNGTLTAGNSSPVTDGASSVLLMSEERAKSEGLDVLAFIKSFEYGAVDPEDGLLMAPAVTIPRILEKNYLTLTDIEVVEIHEAFGAQVLANIMALEKGFRGNPTGPFDMDRVNVSGSSIAIGHPWSATGGRIITTLANEMARRDVKYGLISICAAGAMAGAVLLERN
jgi:acetyl-CoA acetyltransferase family protein